MGKQGQSRAPFTTCDEWLHTGKDVAIPDLAAPTETGRLDLAPPALTGWLWLNLPHP